MSDFGPRANFKEKLAMDQIVFRHIDRTNLAASYSFEASVMQKLNNLPMMWREWVDDQSERYTQTEPTFIFSAPCGIKLGSKENPMLRNKNKPVNRIDGEIDWKDPNIAGAVKRGDSDSIIYVPIFFDDNIPVKRLIGEIDWSDPNIISPKLIEKEYTDYQAMDAVIMEAYEYAGLTWNQNTETFKVATIELPLSKKPTPYHPEQEENEDVKEKEG